MPVTKIRGKAGEIDETVEVVEIYRASKDGKESKGNYLEHLTQVPCIRYPITFWKKSVLVLALFDLGSEVNTIYLTFVKELGLLIRSTDVRA